MSEEYVQDELPFDYQEFPPLHVASEIAAEIGLDAMAALIHETAIDKGFWPPKYYESALINDEPTGVLHNEAISTKLALVHSEVTEVLEAVRKSQGEQAVVEEMADVIIRLLDLWAALKNTGQVDSSLDDMVQLKMRKNTLRPTLHGNKF